MLFVAMKNHTRFRPYQPDQLLLLPPDLREWLPKDDLVYFIIDVVNELRLDAIINDYDNSKGGQPPFNPRLMTILLLYSYCMGIFSSRKIEQATYHSVPFRVLTADQHPDHDTIATFRRRHLKALSSLFIDVLMLCRKAGMIKLGHVALDGTKIRANASKHKNMSYGRMEGAIGFLEDKVRHLFAEAQSTDIGEDNLYGEGKKADELPEHLRQTESRLAKIREAKKALEDEAASRAQQLQPGFEEKKKSWDNRKERRGGRPPKAPSDNPEDKQQRNFTDPDSRIMKDSATGSFEQCYNCQAIVDDENQIIVACAATQHPTDRLQLAPMVQELAKNLQQDMPKILTADAGYYSENNCKVLTQAAIDPLIATGRISASRPLPASPRGRIPKNASLMDRMARKLRTKWARKIYSKRKLTVEPVFGQIKQSRGFRRFSFRGFEKVKAEWNLVCLTHNLLKLFRAGWQPAFSYP